MADEIDRKLIDRRVAQRNLRKGLLDEKEYGEYLKGLPDLEGQTEVVDADLEASAELGVDDDEDEDEAEGASEATGAEQKEP